VSPLSLTISSMLATVDSASWTKSAWSLKTSSPSFTAKTWKMLENGSRDTSSMIGKRVTPNALGERFVDGLRHDTKRIFLAFNAIGLGATKFREPSVSCADCLVNEHIS
jgi:hypothetical protein